jgi:hypothetical protein
MISIVEISQLLTPIGVLVTAWVSWDNKRILKQQNKEQANQSKKLDLVTVTVHENVEQINKIEIATNSMKDQLVAATAKASEMIGHAKGVTDGIQQEQNNPTIGKQP